MERKELYSFTGQFVGGLEDVYDKEEADAVMDAMEARIKFLEEQLKEKN